MRIAQTTIVLAAAGLLAATATGAAAPGAATRTAAGCSPNWKLIAASALPGGQSVQTGLSWVTGASVVSAKNAWFSGSADPGSAAVDSHPWALHWNGKSFRLAPSVPQGPFETRDADTGGSFASATDGWVLGSSSLIPLANQQYAAHWDGTGWTIVPLAVAPDPTSATQPNLRLNAVAALSPSDAWAVGGFYTQPHPVENPAGALIEHWDGTQWAIVPNPGSTAASASYLGALAVVSPSDIWAAGARGIGSGHAVPLVEHWNGSAWKVMPAPAAAAPAVLYGISADGPRDVWAVGAQTNPRTGQAVSLVEHWNGTAWNVVSSLPHLGNSEVTSVYAASPSDVWATVYTVLTNGDIGVENFLHWDGTSWATVPVPGPKEYGLDYDYTSLAGSGPEDVWAAGQEINTVGSSTQTPLLAHLSCG